MNVGNKQSNLKILLRIILSRDKIRGLLFWFHEFLVTLFYGYSDSLIEFKISKPLQKKLLTWSSENHSQVNSSNNKDSGLILNDNKKDHEKDRINSFIINLPPMPIELTKDLHGEIRANIKNSVKSPFAIVNTRSWITLPNDLNDFGPTTIHRDGFSPGHLKVMIYPNSLNEEHGFIEIENNSIVNKSPGTCLMFRNSDLYHRAISGKSENRISIEVTIFRSFMNIDQYHQGHPRGRHYDSIFRPYFLKRSPLQIINILIGKLVDKVKTYFVRIYNSIFLPTRINIGSGVRAWKGWLSMDEINHPSVTKVRFKKDNKIPGKDSKYTMIYSSHFFEHIDDNTLLSILSECERLLKNDGDLVIKIPDFEAMLEKYRQGTLEVKEENGMRHCDTVMWSWENYDVEKSIENRLASMIVGYWNKAYGHHYPSKFINYGITSYHGPARIPAQKLKDLLMNSNIEDIRDTMIEVARADQEFKYFNHRNAWSSERFEEILNLNGFTIINEDKSKINSDFGSLIPDFNQAYSWSKVIHAKKTI